MQRRHGRFIGRRCPAGASTRSRKAQIEAASGAEIVWGGGAGEWRKKWEGDSKRE
jgi:hypothetical protein